MFKKLIRTTLYYKTVQKRFFLNIFAKKEPELKSSNGIRHTEQRIIGYVIN